MYYTYPEWIDFINNFTSLILLITIPAFALVGIALIYIFFLSKEAALESTDDKNEIKAIRIVSWGGLLFFGGLFTLYVYYAFFHLNYSSMFLEAFAGVFMTFVAILTSPLYFIFHVASVDDIKNDIFINAPILMEDIRRWFSYRFGVPIDQVTKSTLLVLFKLITLGIFSTKTYHVSRFLIVNLFGIEVRKASYMALFTFIALVAMYVVSQYDELMNLYSLIRDIILVSIKEGI